MTYNFCKKCCTRFEGCVDCHDAELAAKDKEIARLRAALKVIADYDCECFEDDSCGVCLARLALEPT